MEFVVAVSHGWRFQAHPDPDGKQTELLFDLLSQADSSRPHSGEMRVFYDFVSVPQRPVFKWQADRSESEQRDFQKALKAMPRIFMLADAVVHLAADGTNDSDDEDSIVRLDSALLQSLRLETVGSSLQVMECTSRATPSGATRCEDAPWPCTPMSSWNTEDLNEFWFDGLLDPRDEALVDRVFEHVSDNEIDLYDVVLRVDGQTVHTPADVELVMQSGVDCQVEVQKTPFGHRNRTPARDRGWVFLERFCSMVKIAMVGEEEAERAIFSDSQALLQELRDGGALLRQAAQRGDDALRDVLDHFISELDKKQFIPTSTDKVLDTGGVSGLGSSCNGLSDREVIAALMQDLVADLSAYLASASCGQK